MRYVISLLLAVIILNFAVANAIAQDKPSPPNIVIFLVDDLGSSDVGFARANPTNEPEIPTPNIDSIAKSGTVLEQFYVMHVCSPTRGALMTGRYPIRYGLQTGVIRPNFAYGLPLDERLLPQALKEVGYTTAICGKWHLGQMTPEYLPTRRGFDHQYGHYNGAIDYFTKMRDEGYDWHKDDKELREEGYSTELIAKRCVELIRAQASEAESKGKPLFLYVPFNGVHTPMQAPESYLAKYKHLKGNRAKYAAMLHAVDDAIGSIQAALRETGMDQNTLTFFSTDNGGPSPGQVTRNGNLRAGKGTLYEGGVRSCCAISWPGHIPAGERSKEPLHIVDLYPTLLEVTGAPQQQKLPVDGKSFWKTITEGAPSPHDEILINAEADRGALRRGDWKLVVVGGKNRSDGVELYNLKEDPSEKKNVASENLEKVTELQTLYAKYSNEAVPAKATTVTERLPTPKVWGEFTPN